MPEDAKEAIGHGVKAKTLKIGGDELRCPGDGSNPCPDPVKSVAALASALAKAQAEIVNPEKSLTAIIRTGRPGERRTQLPLCATVKRPRHRAQDAGPARDRHSCGPTAHQSGLRHGQLDDNARPCLRRMDRIGLAGLCHCRNCQSSAHGHGSLTYARRYALLTFVGIAGEDDLDAPRHPEWRALVWARLMMPV